MLQTADFPYDDPWSELTRRVVGDLRDAGALDGQHFLEAGLGDARNALLALDFGDGGAERLTGIELDEWRLKAARYNLKGTRIDPGRIALYQGDIIEWLQGDDEPIAGWSLACLPQAPHEATENDADGYQDFDTLEAFYELPLGDHTADVYGLTLNAAYLAALRKRAASDDLNALVTLSDRVPRHVFKELFAATGWAVSDVHTATEPVQQDPDTGVEWTVPFDDGKRFYERDADGLFVPLPAPLAEYERRKSLEDHGEEARDHLNVYHGLSVYHLKPVWR